MFSPTFIIGNSARCWNTIFTLRLLGARLMTLSPLMRISPVLGVSNPAIIRIRVVLPQPEGPRIEKNEPGGISSETFLTAVNSPNFFVTPTQLRSFIPDLSEKW